jgi:hypothetical protein
VRRCGRCAQHDGRCTDQAEAVDAEHGHQRQAARDELAEARSGMGHVSLLHFSQRMQRHVQVNLQVNFIKIVKLSSHVSGNVIGENRGMTFKFQRKHIVKVAIAGLTPV